MRSPFRLNPELSSAYSWGAEARDGDRDEAAISSATRLRTTRRIIARTPSAGCADWPAGPCWHGPREKYPAGTTDPVLATTSRNWARLWSGKFTRDQEREADEFGLSLYGFGGLQPRSAIAWPTHSMRTGLGGIGLFFDSHPGWEETRIKVQDHDRPTTRACARLCAGTKHGGHASRHYHEPTDRSATVGAAAELLPAQALFIEPHAAFRRIQLASAVDSLRKAVNSITRRPRCCSVSLRSGARPA